MRWSDEERRVFYELWGVEAPPKGWNLWVERLAHLMGEERRLRRVAMVHIGGDPVVVSLALRAQARHAPASHTVWSPPSFWGAAAYPWLADAETALRLSEILRRPPTADLAELLRSVRGEALAVLDTHGGSWSRVSGPVRCAPVGSVGFVWVVAPSGPRPVEPPPRGPVETRLSSLFKDVVRTAQVWPARESVMMGGCASRVVVLGPDKWRNGEQEEAFLERMDLPYPGNGSISLARSLWWERVEALASSPAFV